MFARTAKIRPDLRLQLCMTGLYFYFLLIGLFAAAHDVNLEWVIVKGISHFSDNSNTRNESWKSFASIMAASLVSNMLSDPVVFKEWPHYEGMKPPFLVCLLIVNFLLRCIYLSIIEKKLQF